VLLPTVSELEKNPTAPEESSSARSVVPLSILLVEDEPTVREVTRAILERAGHRVLVAEAGLPALQLLGTLKDSLDLLITDVVMPEMSGPTLADRVRESRPGLQVLFISGHTRGARTEDGEFLAKPYSAQTLLSKVQEMALGAP
jgi:CheY-like chemotaxis protein